MAIPLVINGQTFEYPVTFDENWGVNATGWAQAVTNGMLQRSGGNFPLTADANFGASFGLVSLYYKSRSTPIATTGTVRLASADPGVVFRNNANSGNLVLTTDSSDNLLYNGHIVGASGAGSVLSITGTVNQVIASSPTGNVTLSLPQNIAITSSPTFLGLSLSNPLTVSNGGTGASSLTAYAVLTGGTTSSTPIQSIASVGLAGQVLTSNGPGALPSFSNTTGSGTVNSGTVGNIAYYATSSAAVSDSLIVATNVFLADGSVSATGAFNLNSHKITNLTNGSSAQDAAAFGQITAANASALPLAGGTMSGAIAMGTNKITGLGNGTATTDAAAFGQVKLIQTTVTQSTTDFTTTSSTYTTVTNMQLSITPTSSSATHRIVIQITGLLQAGAGGACTYTVFRDAVDLGGTGGFGKIAAGAQYPVAITWTDLPTTTSSVSYSLRIKQATSGTAQWGASSSQQIMLQEVVLP